MCSLQPHVLGVLKLFLLLCWYVCLSVCQPPRVLVTSGMALYDHFSMQDPYFDCQVYIGQSCSAPYAYIGPQAYGTSHTSMGYPVRIWANIMYHTRMGIPYEYACMIVHSYTTCTPGITFCLLTKYQIVYYKNHLHSYSQLVHYSQLGSNQSQLKAEMSEGTHLLSSIAAIQLASRINSCPSSCT